jgi:serine acetyltransferase
LLMIEMLPAALPADVGANVVLNEELPPGMIVMGVTAPLML